MTKVIAAVLAGLLLVACDKSPTPPPPSPTWTLNGSCLGKPVVVRANERFGAAIYSITWGGFEFLDSTDHGRELQTAWQLNGTIENENPTEAGSSQGAHTRVLSANVTGNVLTSKVNPAYWLQFNGQWTSPHILEKTVTLDGCVLHHKIGMTLVGDHRSMGVEGITGYVPRTFTRFFVVGAEKPAPPKTGWQMIGSATPVVLFDGTHAIGCKGGSGGYGFIEGWPKFNCESFGATPARGNYSWEVFTSFGTLDSVFEALRSN